MMPVFAAGEVEDVQAAARLTGAVLDGDPEQGIADYPGALGEIAKFRSGGVKERVGFDAAGHLFTVAF
jgi:hypothetical protein